MKILQPTSIALDHERLGLEPGDTVRLYGPAIPIAEEDTDADVFIAWANTTEQLADSAARLKNVGLVQALLAGPDAARAAGFRSRLLFARVWVCTRRPWLSMPWR